MLQFQMQQRHQFAAQQRQQAQQQVEQVQRNINEVQAARPSARSAIAPAANKFIIYNSSESSERDSRGSKTTAN
jgi:hypothetical protein